MLKAVFGFIMLFLAVPVMASGSSGHLGLTGAPIAIAALVFFLIAYALVIAEEFIHLRKSKPVIFAAGVIWILVAIAAKQVEGGTHLIESAIDHNLKEYSALLLFLLTAMIYINAMTDRNIFEALRAYLVRRGLSYKALFWITGWLAFFISPIADNLTTALIMGAVVLAVGADKPDFVTVSFIGIVVGANAGGAFSPFGDITTLMVWQSGHVDFFHFFALFVPAVLNYLIPAAIMSMAVPAGLPEARDDKVQVLQGGYAICFLFLCTIVTAVSFEQVLHLPPFLGMMTGLSYLFFFSYYIKRTQHKPKNVERNGIDQFNIFNKVAKAEWDTLLFFFGVIFCVGGLGALGYLSAASHFMYDGWGPTVANITVGILSAIVDNIPVMFAVLTMSPEMDLYQWLLVTFTAGVGGSLLSVGSAAGVALMGQSKGMYTFFGHLKWSWAIGVGYAVSIYAHYLINS